MQGLVVVAIMCGAVAVAGCSQTAAKARWSKPGSSAGDLDRAWTQCLYEAEQGTPQSRGDPIATGISDGLRNVKLREMCMQAKGYQQG